MKKRRMRFKQTVSLQERLAAFAREIRDQASRLPPGSERDELLRKAKLADTAASIDRWRSTPGIELTYLEIGS